MSAAAPADAPALVRDADPDDVPAVQAIYAHHVLTGTASFEETPPDAAEMARRMTAAQGAGLPFLVAEAEGRILGYAYASQFRPRAAYRYTLENSVYVAPDAGGRGTGRALMERLIEHCTEAGYRRMIAVIGDSQNTPSIALHRKMGFRHVGTIRSSGFKFGRWVDTVYMERPLGEGDSTLPG